MAWYGGDKRRVKLALFFMERGSGFFEEPSRNVRKEKRDVVDGNVSGGAGMWSQDGILVTISLLFNTRLLFRRKDCFFLKKQAPDQSPRLVTRTKESSWRARLVGIQTQQVARKRNNVATLFWCSNAWPTELYTIHGQRKVRNDGPESKMIFACA